MHVKNLCFFNCPFRKLKNAKKKKWEAPLKNLFYVQKNTRIGECLERCGFDTTSYFAH